MQRSGGRIVLPMLEKQQRERGGEGEEVTGMILQSQTQDAPCLGRL